MTESEYFDFYEFTQKAEEDNNLRDYQIKHKKEIYSNWNLHNNIMLQMPTGTGKTRLFVSICKDILRYTKISKKFHKVLILAHRTELIEQISENLGVKYGIAHSKIVSGLEQNLKMQFQVASVQTLYRRIKEITNLKFDFIIIDEAHHAVARTYIEILSELKSGKVLGVTATPVRLGKGGFSSVFEKLIISLSIKEFVSKQVLSNYEYYSVKKDSNIQQLISKIKLDRITGDFADKDLIKKLDNEKIRANLLETYQKFADNKKGIIYTIDQNHNRHVCQKFLDAGYKAVAIDSKTKSNERIEIIKQFKEGKIKILCNVNIFSEGFDCPDIEFIQLARPTKSLAMYLQQIGRGLRMHEDINTTIFLDNVGSFNQFGLPSTNRKWMYHFNGNHEINYVEEANNQVKNGEVKFIDEGDEDLFLIEEQFPLNLIEPFYYFSRNVENVTEECNSYYFNTINDICKYYGIESIHDYYSEYELFIEYCNENGINFHDNFILFKKENKVGLIEAISKEIVLPCCYDSIEFSDFLGRSEITLDSKKGIFDCLSRKIILEPKYDDVEVNFEKNLINLYILKDDDFVIVFDSITKKQIHNFFGEVFFHNNLIHCFKYNSWSIYSLNFDLIEFELCERMKIGDKLFFKYNNLLGFEINGDVKFPPIISDVQVVGNFYFIKAGYSYKLYNNLMELVLFGSYIKIENVINDIYKILSYSESLWGIIKVSEKMVSFIESCDFQDIHFEENVIYARKNNLWQLIINGRVVFEASKKAEVKKMYKEKKENEYKAPKKKNVYNVGITKQINEDKTLTFKEEMRIKFINELKEKINFEGERLSPSLRELYKLDRIKEITKNPINYFKLILEQIGILDDCAPSKKFPNSVYESLIRVFEFDLNQLDNGV